ncbi:MAG: thioredoxin-dependent thiol peroxidase [Gammaproteobacteria bacterium]
MRLIVNIGDEAPNFTLIADNNETVSLKQFRGKKVILYFYPKDNTPGCTQEACDFRDQFVNFNQHDAIILGISKDKPETHRKFKQKYALPFTLLSDTDAKVCEAYGVINPKSLFGKTFLGIQRSTFLIDEKGILQGIWRKVKVPKHAETVLNQL